MRLDRGTQFTAALHSMMHPTAGARAADYAGPDTFYISCDAVQAVAGADPAISVISTTEARVIRLLQGAVKARRTSDMSTWHYA